MPVKKTEEIDPWTTSVEPNPIDKDRVVITLKSGAGYDASWIVGHFASVEEAITVFEHDEWPRLVELTAARAREFQKSHGKAPGSVAPASSAPSWAGGSSNSSQAVTGGSQPSGVCPTHNCELVYAPSFKKRDGSEVSARVACPVPKCYAKTFWQNKDGSWTEK